MAKSVFSKLLHNFLLFVVICDYSVAIFENSEIKSVSLFNKTSEFSNDSNSFVFILNGTNLYENLHVQFTLKKSEKETECNEMLDFNIFKINRLNFNGISTYLYQLIVPKMFKEKVYLCLGNNLKYWIHQGGNVSIDFNSLNSIEIPSQKSNQTFSSNDLRIVGIRYEIWESGREKSPDFDPKTGVPILLIENSYFLRLFGFGITKKTILVFTKIPGSYGEPCIFPSPVVFPVFKESNELFTSVVKVKLGEVDDVLYICAAEGNVIGNIVTGNLTKPFVHQGSSPWLQIRAARKFLPLWLQVIIIAVCLCFSCLFSGLNLGLMAMDQTELQILINTGNETERKYAKAIAPVRAKGNFLLCTILLGNVLVNSIFTIFLDDLTSGWIAIIFSTVCIVIMGEILPQAFCSRHGLAVGAKTLFVTKLVMIITFPLSYPISKTLDCLLGEEISNIYTRERLKELVKLQVVTGKNDLDKDEVNIISGALELRKKTVADVMTKIEDVFMLDYDAVLDFETVSEIMKSGFSRIPVYEGNRKNIVTMLYIKDLAFVDPDDNTPLKTLCQFYQNPCNFVFNDTTLDVMFRIFKEGNKGHMAFVQRVNNEGEGDPFYETVGIMTLEDVIEELIQAEIMDETDVYTDNKHKRRRNRDRTKQDFSVFAEKKNENNKVRISPQLTLAAFQYLSTSVGPFRSDCISETILLRLLKQDVYHIIKKNKDWKNDPSTIIYQEGKPADYFTLILEGRVEVTIGRENLVFESGSFTFFGTQALMQNMGVADSPSSAHNGSLHSLNMDSLVKSTFLPDYTVRACVEVVYLKIQRSLYLAAKRATLMERSQRDSTVSGEQFDFEVEKLLHAIDDEENFGCKSPEDNRQIITSHRSSITASTKVATPKLLSPQATNKNNNQLSPSKVMNNVSFKKQIIDDDSPLTEQNYVENDDKEEEKVSLLTTV